MLRNLWKKLKLNRAVRPNGQRWRGHACEELETRRLLTGSVNVLSYRYGEGANGVNSNETQLTPANVKVGSFGKLYTVPVDGNIYAEPLVVTGVTIANGPNTTAGAAGVHTVTYVETENDTIYAIDGSQTGGQILWQRSFLNTAVAANNTLGATSITPVNDADLTSTDISPVVGITGTPVINLATNTMYVVVSTEETIGGVIHYVQRLHAISLSDGTDQVTPFLIGDTQSYDTNNTQIYVYGDGDGSVTDPYNGTGNPVVQFNARRENQRGALEIVNNTLYVVWASHGDQGPFHGWVVAWNIANLMTTGNWVMTGVLNTSPNGGEAGIWQGGAGLEFEPDGSAFYFETGNGTAGHGNTQLNAAGFPVDGDYYDALVKVEADPTTTPKNQNINGWGFKVVDYFIPFDQVALDNADRDFGSGGPIVLPSSVSLPGYPNLLLAAGKEGKIYLVDRDDMGEYDPNNDHVINSVPNGSGNNTPPVQLDASLSTPAFFNNTIYWVSGYSSYAYAFQIQSNGTLAVTSQTPENTFGYIPGSVVISSNGTNDGIVWIMDRNTNEIHAYDANSLATELWNSGEAPGGADALGAVTKFASPTIANGEVYVGTMDSLVVYGLTPPANAVPNPPVLTATALSSNSVNLTWTDSTQEPNLAGGYTISDSTDGVHFSPLTTAAADSTSLAIGGLNPLTTYYFQIQGFNGLGNSTPSNIASATTTNTAAGLNLSGGFAGAAGQITLNGSAVISGSALQLTNNAIMDQAGSAFTNAGLYVGQFSTQFTFQLTGGAQTADGFTFTIQGSGPTAIGSYGGGLGYATDGSDGTNVINNSVAIKFDLYSNGGEGPDSTGLYTDGATPTNNSSINLSSTGINFHSGDTFQVNMSYNGTTLVVVILDTVTQASATQTYTVNIPAIVGNSLAYIGFTGGTGGGVCAQDILTWTFTPNVSQAPNAPTGLSASPVTATTIALTWNSTATTQTGFYLDRATDSGFTDNFVTQTLPATPNSFTDSYTGLAPGDTFYYRIRSFNSAGVSANSNVFTVTIPLAPAKATNQQVISVTTNQINMSWTDNAGVTATGYNILRSVNGGTFVNYILLPSTSDAPPTTYSWSDTGLSPATEYEYHIQAINTSGNNDFVGLNAETLTTAPTGLTATYSAGAVNLSWTAPTGAVEYNVYRGTAPGGELSTPLATVTTGTTYTDTSLTPGVTYFYVVTALNGNITHSPPVNAESAPSSEVSAAIPGSALSLPNGFVGVTSLMTLNGSAAIVGTALQLTNQGENEAGSAFLTNPLNISNFVSQFTFQLSNSTTSADGFTFTIQGVGPTALGSNGGGLGYGTNGITTTAIGSSVAIKFDLFSNGGEGVDSTGLYTDGAAPTNNNSINLTPSGINLHNGDLIRTTMNYNGTTLTVTLVDVSSGKTATESYTVNIPSIVGSSMAYMGFTGATGGGVCTQNILSWTINTPLQPTSAVATALSTTSAKVTWANSATNQTGFHIDRATNSSFTQNLVTITTPSTPYSYIDTGLTPGTTYYYRIRAYNAQGDSLDSNAAHVTLAIVPAAPTSPQIFSVTTSTIGLSWTDNAGTTATGYTILRSVNGGAFASYMSLPAATAAAPSQYIFTDTGLTAGTAYAYEIEAVGTGGNSAFITANATTLTAAPTGLTATTGVSTGSIALAWIGATGAIEYNIYRGTAAGAEGATPIATVTGTTYTDSSGVAGTTYYYKVTAVNANINLVPPSAAESAKSNEASALANVVFSKMQLNGSASVSGGVLNLVNGAANQNNSAFTTTTVSVNQFTTSFDFQVPASSNAADGFTFTLQGDGPTAVGSYGGGLGYGVNGTAQTLTIPKSIAIKFDLYSNGGEGPDSTGLYLDGATPTNVGSVNLSSTGINFHSGDVFHVTIAYNGTTLTVTILDKTTLATATQTYTVNIGANIGATAAYAGFTAGTGALTSTINILDWTYTPLA